MEIKSQNPWNSLVGGHIEPQCVASSFKMRAGCTRCIQNQGLPAYGPKTLQQFQLEVQGCPSQHGTLDPWPSPVSVVRLSMWRISSRSSGQKSLVHHPMLECFPRNIWKPQVQREVIFSTHPQVETVKHVNVGEESLLPCKSQKHIHYKDIQRLQNILTKPTSTTKTSGTM